MYEVILTCKIKKPTLTWGQIGWLVEFYEGAICRSTALDSSVTSLDMPSVFRCEIQCANVISFQKINEKYTGLFKR